MYKFKVGEQIRLIANWINNHYVIEMPDGRLVTAVALKLIDEGVLDWCNGNVHQMRDFVIEFRG